MIIKNDKNIHLDEYNFEIRFYDFPYVLNVTSGNISNSCHEISNNLENIFFFIM